MLDVKVDAICVYQGGYKGCSTCPLYAVCSMPHEQMEGETLTEKTAYWEARMNEAAKGVDLYEHHRNHHNG